MAKESADEGPKTDRSSPPWPANASPLSADLPVVAETEKLHGLRDNETTSENQVDNMEATIDRPTSPASTTNPWSTSATLPVSSELGAHDQADLGAVREEHATSPTPWSTSATLPVSPEDEHHEEEAPAEPEATTAAPVTEKKKKFSKAEYQVAFKHFIRIFSYSTWTDKLLLFAACLASICTGITLPLMNVVFGMYFTALRVRFDTYNEIGRLVGVFGKHYNAWSGETEAMFTAIINQNV